VVINYFQTTFINIFGANPIAWHSVDELQKSAPEIIVAAIPFLFLFAGIECYLSYRQNKSYYSLKETIGSLFVGIGNVVISTWIKALLFYLAILIYNAIPWRMELISWTFLPCYILFDFCSYWAHRISHKQRFWWATHVAHHTGEHYNLTVAFRLSWVQYLKVVFLFPVPLAGFHPFIFFTTNQIAILYQFWIHTEYIRKLPRVVEYIFVTPSNHRVHHGSQPKYIDKNFGATFIIWDRMFGTYQKEEEQVIYGITQNIQHKANPIYINFHEYHDMFRDAWKATGWRRKLFFIFGDPSKIAEFKKTMELDNTRR
jgi:sterol desaturase/sphingolipid hydroxylase (fatty acid hydroxylase superfamily)